MLLSFEYGVFVFNAQNIQVQFSLGVINLGHCQTLCFSVGEVGGSAVCVCV